jgi:predicted CXXCH cytochrome family protein
MSRGDLIRIICLFFLFLGGIMCKGEAFAFTTADEYLSHSREAPTCVNGQCHEQLRPGVNKLLHEPVASAQCSLCHKAEAYPQKFGLEQDQSIVCNGCHAEMGDEIRMNQFIHGPIKDGNCSVCHDPHSSDRQFYLKDLYRELCSLCHHPATYAAGKSIHQPVKDGNCGLCHDPHASNYQFRLTDVGANLCISCHEETVTDITSDVVHTPLVESGCTDCHDPHSGEEKLRLREPVEQICFTCHKDKKNEVSHYTSRHEPAFEGRCVSCHSPHASTRQYLLRNEVDSLCFSCHKDRDVWKAMQFQHGPVVQGNCAACHNPHGSDNANILRMPFPVTFYTPYEDGKYSLCFLCHKEAMITVEKTETTTSFRNGEINLHSLHVKQEKGRTCRACHDIHASDHEHHMREEFQFGKATLPLYYFKTSTGGRCIPGCHKERGYDRVNMIINKK